VDCVFAFKVKVSANIAAKTFNPNFFMSPPGRYFGPAYRNAAMLIKLLEMTILNTRAVSNQQSAFSPETDSVVPQSGVLVVK
jgi:hypothetical protein